MSEGREDPGITRMEWSGWSWSPRRRVPWLGVLLVVFGLAMLVDQLTPLSASALILGALAIAFGASWLIGGSRWAMVPALVLAALAIPDALTDLKVITGDGWGSVALAIAFLAIWLRGGRAGPCGRQAMAASTCSSVAPGWRKSRRISPASSKW